MGHAQLVDRGGLATELRTLAAEPLLAERATELLCLADDLEADRDLEAWAELDLVAAYARPESLVEPAPPAPPRRGSWAWFRTLPFGREYFVEALLGIMVFVPLMITWFGLREATQAYGDLARERPEQATRPFLQLWQAGFDGELPAYARFGTVALAAFVLIWVMIVIAGWHGFARRRDAREAEQLDREQDLLLARLASTLTRTQLCLSTHRLTSPGRFTRELSKAATQLAEVTAQAREGNRMLHDASQTVHAAADALRTASGTLSAQVPVFTSAVTDVENAVRVGVDSLHQAHTAATDQLRTAHDAVLRTGTDTTAALAGVRTALDTVGERVDRSLSDVGERVENALTEVGSRVDKALTGVGDRLNGAGDTVDTALKDLTAVQQSLVAVSQSAADAMSHSADRVGGAVAGMAEAAERWDAAAAHWQDAAQRVEDGVDALTAAPRGGVDVGRFVPRPGDGRTGR